MKKKLNPLETLQEMRRMMQEAFKFLLLSGFAGILAGLFILVGTFTKPLWIQKDMAGKKNLVAQNAIRVCVKTFAQQEVIEHPPKMSKYFFIQSL